MENHELYVLAEKRFAERLAAVKPVFRIKKRRSATERLKARMYYQRHKAQIRRWRQRYNQKNKMLHNVRKFMKRPKPTWLSKSTLPKSSQHNSFRKLIHGLVHGTQNKTQHFSLLHHDPKKFKIHIPKFRSPGQAHI